MYRTPGSVPPPGKIRIEIDDDTEIAERLRAYADKVQSQQRAYKAHYDSLPEQERKGMPLPVEDTVGRLFDRVLRDGAAGVLCGARPPNSVLVINGDPLRVYERGERFNLPVVCLPIGAEVIAIETSREDGPNFFVSNLWFGSMNLVDPQGACDVSLSTFRYVTRHDLLSVFDHCKTKVDIQVGASLLCKTDGATFDGFRLHLRSEEQFCRIASRIEHVECDHPESECYPLVFVDASMSRYGSYPGSFPYPGALRQFGTSPGKRYRCTRCGRVVVRESDLAAPPPSGLAVPALMIPK